MKVTVISSELNVKTNFWEIVSEHSDLPTGEPPVQVKHAMPYDTMIYRAAEYGINPADLDTLTDIVICEPFIKAEFFDGDDSLFNAGDIATARERYLAEIARIKLLYRISTRGKDHPLNEMKRTIRIKPADVAVKSFEVIMARHRSGVQVLDPHVAGALNMMETALRTGNQDIDLSGGKSRA